ncbi:MAG: mRNA surveillance protein pelota [Candidatus Micrarchaeia archaeon]
MRIIHFDEKSGEMKLVPEVAEDLWHIERVLEKGDILSAKTERRFRVQEGDSGEKKPVFIELSAEKIEFSRSENRLRITGKIMRGEPEEYVSIGSYHTIEIELHKPIKITKEWKKHEIERIRNAEHETKKPLITVVAIDEKLATFAHVKGYGVEEAFRITCSASKQDERREEKYRKYLSQIMEKISSEEGKIFIAGPGFAKDDLKKLIEKENHNLLKRIFFDTCSSAEISGVYELLKRGAIAKAIGSMRLEREFEAVESILREISKDGMAAYGTSEVEKALSYGAVKLLLITDEILRTSQKAQELYDYAEKTGAEVLVVSSETNAGAQLASIGGIAALLRFKPS